MPVFSSRSIFEIARGVKAFVDLRAGVTRGAVENAVANGDSGQTRELQARLHEKENEVAALSKELNELRAATGGISKIQDKTVEQFHKLYYDSGFSGETWRDTYWMGVPIWKRPLDLWLYQEMIFDLKPDLIVETGTAFGGSSLFLAGMCDLVGNGEVITIDIQDLKQSPEHERVSRLLGSSTPEEVLKEVRRRVEDSETVMVILDSDHAKSHVLEELEAYKDLVTKGSYLVVEDTNVNGNPVLPDHGPGPMEAVEEFFSSTKDFIIDESKEKFYMTFNPKGCLKKVG